MSNLNAIYNLNGVPFYTYGMIGLTTVVLAVVTMMDNDSKSFAKDDGYAQTVATGSKQNDSMLGNLFGSTSQPTGQNKQNDSMFGNFFGSTSQPTGQNKESDSMFGNLFGNSSEPSNQSSSMFGSTDNSGRDYEPNRNTRANVNQNRSNDYDEDEEDYEGDDRRNEYRGGKYKKTNKKTKHNRRQNTYTRKL